MMLRNPFLAKPLTILIGVIFLNLSFVLAEVSALDFENHDSALFENLVRLISTSGFEEEKDANGEPTHEISSDVNFYIQQNLKFPHIKSLIISNLNGSYSSAKVSKAYQPIFSPPPEI